MLCHVFSEFWGLAGQSYSLFPIPDYHIKIVTISPKSHVLNAILAHFHLTDIIGWISNLLLQIGQTKWTWTELTAVQFSSVQFSEPTLLLTSNQRKSPWRLWSRYLPVGTPSPQKVNNDILSGRKVVHWENFSEAKRNFVQPEAR